MLTLISYRDFESVGGGPPWFKIDHFDRTTPTAEPRYFRMEGQDGALTGPPFCSAEGLKRRLTDPSS